MDVGECIVPDGAYHAKRKNEHVYQRAVFRCADTYLPRLPLFPLFVTRPAYDAMVSDSGKWFCCRGAFRCGSAVGEESNRARP